MSNTPYKQVTFWHNGIEKVVNGELNGKTMDRKQWIGGAWHVCGHLLEVMWTDGNGRAWGTWIAPENILDTVEA